MIECTFSYIFPQVAVGTKPNGTELMDWTSVGVARELLLDHLSLQEQQMYYFTVEATNAAGLKSVGHTDGITVSTLFLYYSVTLALEASLNPLRRGLTWLRL